MISNFPGLDYWNGLLEWTACWTDHFCNFMLTNKVHLPVELHPETYQNLPGWADSFRNEGLRTRVVYPTIKCGEWPEMPNKWKKMVYPLLPKCSNFQITEFSPALETDFESIFVSGGYNQGGRGLDHFASEPFIY